MATCSRITMKRVNITWSYIIFTHEDHHRNGHILLFTMANCKDFHLNSTGTSLRIHYDDVIMDSIASQITSLTIVYSTFHSGADQSKHQSSASLAFVWEIHRWPVNFPHKWPVTRKIFPLDDVIMIYGYLVGVHILTHWDRDKIFHFPDDIFKSIFGNENV